MKIYLHDAGHMTKMAKSCIMRKPAFIICGKGADQLHGNCVADLVTVS